MFLDYLILAIMFALFLYIVIRTERIVKAHRTESKGPGDTVYHEDEEKEDDTNAHLKK